MGQVLAKAVRAVRRDGVQGLSAAGRRWLNRQLGPEPEELFILPRDVIVDPPVLPPALAVAPGSTLRVGWLLTPPGKGSGGHTTIFRMVEALERSGHECVIWVYDGQGGPKRDFEPLIRQWWPGVRAHVRDVSEATANVDAIVATAWQTAHVASMMANAARRFYFVQDYEPWFTGQGVASDLARRTYGFGFETLTVGAALADVLRRLHGIEATPIPFGCDHAVYSADAHSDRDSVVFYSRPGVARRGYELGIQALEAFHRARPTVGIDVVGQLAGKPAFPCRVHRTLRPAELNDLYRRARAGLVLSYTNVSLVPFELLAAGVVPVMIDLELCRSEVDGRFAVWAAPAAEAMAEALAAGFDLQRAAGAEAVAASAAAHDWAQSGASFVGAIEAACSRSRGALDAVWMGE